MCWTIHNILIFLLCSPSSLIVKRLKMMCIVSNIAVIMCLRRKKNKNKTCLSANICFYSSPLAMCILGTRAAELLINKDQNPQCGNNGPQTLHCLCLPRSRSDIRWLHSLQPQLWVCYFSRGYVYDGVDMRGLGLYLCLHGLCSREDYFLGFVIKNKAEEH